MSTRTAMSRRSFIQSAASTGLVLGAIPAVMAAPADREFKVALVGCGGRGKGALRDFMEAAKITGVKTRLVAAADFFPGPAKGVCKDNGLDEKFAFGGADGYRKAIEQKPDVMLIATPPNFRPLHYEAAAQAGIHVFAEKPVAVDPVGVRRFLEAGKISAQKNLALVAGTQRRHQAGYQQNAFAVQNGAVGKILGGTIHWCGGRLWYKTRNAGEADDAYMVRNWTSFAEMSGDHIVEQHVHNIDVANWFIGRHPVSALGFGGRARRKTGNQFDFFSVDFDYGDGVHIHSMCRQVTGCYDRVGEYFRAETGEVHGGGKLTGGRPVELPKFEDRNPYVQEHVDLLKSILAEKPLNESQAVAEATMCAIMGRISAYTGQLVRWSDVMENPNSPYFKLALAPSADDFEKGAVKAPADDVIQVPGKD